MHHVPRRPTTAASIRSLKIIAHSPSAGPSIITLQHISLASGSRTILERRVDLLGDLFGIVVRSLSVALSGLLHYSSAEFASGSSGGRRQRRACVCATRSNVSFVEALEKKKRVWTSARIYKLATTSE